MVELRPAWGAGAAEATGVVDAVNPAPKPVVADVAGGAPNDNVLAVVVVVAATVPNFGALDVFVAAPNEGSVDVGAEPNEESADDVAAPKDGSADDVAAPKDGSADAVVAPKDGSEDAVATPKDGGALVVAAPNDERADVVVDAPNDGNVGADAGVAVVV